MLKESFLLIVLVLLCMVVFGGEHQGKHARSDSYGTDFFSPYNSDEHRMDGSGGNGDDDDQDKDNKDDNEYDYVGTGEFNEWIWELNGFDGDTKNVILLYDKQFVDFDEAKGILGLLKENKGLLKKHKISFYALEKIKILRLQNKQSSGAISAVKKRQIKYCERLFQISSLSSWEDITIIIPPIIDKLEYFRFIIGDCFRSFGANKRRSVPNVPLLFVNEYKNDGFSDAFVNELCTTERINEKYCQILPHPYDVILKLTNKQDIMIASSAVKNGYIANIYHSLNYLLKDSACSWLENHYDNLEAPLTQFLQTDIGLLVFLPFDDTALSDTMNNVIMQNIQQTVSHKGIHPRTVGRQKKIVVVNSEYIVSQLEQLKMTIFADDENRFNKFEVQHIEEPNSDNIAPVLMDAINQYRSIQHLQHKLFTGSSKTHSQSMQKLQRMQTPEVVLPTKEAMVDNLSEADASSVDIVQRLKRSKSVGHSIDGSVAFSGSSGLPSSDESEERIYQRRSRSSTENDNIATQSPFIAHTEKPEIIAPQPKNEVKDVDVYENSVMTIKNEDDKQQFSGADDKSHTETPKIHRHTEPKRTSMYGRKSNRTTRDPTVNPTPSPVHKPSNHNDDMERQEKYVRIARMGFIGSGVVVFIVCIWNTIRFIKMNNKERVNSQTDLRDSLDQVISSTVNV